MAAGATFTARYHGECQICDGAIFPGDTAGYVDDEIACEECLTEARIEDEAFFDGT